MSSPLSDWVRPFRGRLACALTLQAISGLLALLPWVALERLVRLGLEATSLPPAQLGLWLGVAVFGSAAWLLCQALSQHLTHGVDADWGHALRQRLVTHLDRVPLVCFHRLGPDGVMRHAYQDILALHQWVAHMPGDLTRLIVVPTAAALYLAWLDIGLLAFAVVPVVLATLCYRRLNTPARQQAAQARHEALERLSADYAQVMRHPALVRLYPGQGLEARAQDAARRFGETFESWVRQVATLAAGAELLLSAPLLLAWVSMGAWCLHGPSIPLSVLAVFLLLVRTLAAPVQILGHGWDAVREGRAAAQRLEGLLNIAPLPDGRSTEPPAHASLEMSNVCVHVPGRALLSHIDLRIAAGSFTAIVGPSGAGKSTLLMLAARFLDPDTGTVRLGGQDVRSLPFGVLYRHLALVLQHTPALDISLAENIALLTPHATPEAVAQAARSAGLEARIRELPRGDATVCGRDVQLSGGELQRLSLARACLSPATLWLLDEPTSALDPATAATVQQTILHEHTRTRLVVTHDLQLAAQADQILVMNQGAIVDRGTHGPLLERGGLYAELWVRQQRDTPGAASSTLPEIHVA